MIFNNSKRPILPLNNNVFTRFLPWLVGFMVYIAILILSVSFISQSIGEKWTAGITKNLSVQILYDENISDNKRAEILDRATIMISQTQGVQYARALSRKELNALLAPWLGGGLNYTNLPIPDMIDVQIEKGVDIDIKLIEDNLSKVTEDIIIDNHQEWRQKVQTIIKSIRNIIGILTTLIFICSIFMVIAGTHGLMSMNKDTINMLLIMGATDKFISSDFCNHAFFLGLKGSIGGFLFAMLTVLSLWVIGQQAGSPLDLQQYMSLASFIPITVLISTISAFLTVKTTLKKRFNGVEKI